VGDKFKTEWARAFLRDYPTSAALTALTERRWQRWAREHRLGAERASELWDVIQRPHLSVLPHVVRVNARLVGALVEQLDVTLRTVQAYREAIADFFASMPAAKWALSLPGAESGTTVPTLYAELGDAVGRWQSFRHLQGHAGTVLVTDRSGKLTLVRFRFACNMHLRQAVHWFAFHSLTKSEWAKCVLRPMPQAGS